MAKRNKWIMFGGALAVALGFIILQLWRYQGELATNPPVLQEPQWDSEYTQLLVERACYDCHSNETYWPWYAQISPISIMIQEDVAEGREVLNFSEWDESCCTVEQIEAMAETVGKDQMPLPYYLVFHPEAKLTDVERGHLLNGLIATMEGIKEE